MTAQEFLITVALLAWMFAFVTQIGTLILSAVSYRYMSQLDTKENSDAVERVWLDTDYIPTVTVIMPAYNEEPVICDAVDGMLRSDYRNLEVIVVNDGSKDDTLRVLIDHFRLVPSPPPAAIQHTTAMQRPTLTHNEVVAVWKPEPSYFHKEHRLVVVDKRNGGKRTR